MTITLFDRLRPYLSKILASIIVPALAWLAAKTGIGVFADPELAEAVREVALIWLTLTVAHTGFAKYFNPGNVASAHLAHAQVEETKVLVAKENG